MTSENLSHVFPIPKSKLEAEFVGRKLATDFLINHLLELLRDQSRHKESEPFRTEDFTGWIQDIVNVPGPAIASSFSIRFSVRTADDAIANGVDRNDHLRISFVNRMKGIKAWIERNQPIQRDGP